MNIQNLMVCIVCAAYIPFAHSQAYTAERLDFITADCPDIALNNLGWVAAGGNIYRMDGPGSKLKYYLGERKITAKSLDDQGRVAGYYSGDRGYSRAFVTGPRGVGFNELNGNSISSEAILSKGGVIALTSWKKSTDPGMGDQPSLEVGKVDDATRFNVGPVRTRFGDILKYPWRVAGVAVNSSLQVAGHYDRLEQSGAVLRQVFATGANGQDARHIEGDEWWRRGPFTVLDINERGQMLVLAENGQGSVVDRDGGVRFLYGFQPFSMNDHGQLVGTVGIRAALYDVDGTYYDLNDLTAMPNGLNANLEACRINNNGDIVARSNSSIYFLTKRTAPEIHVPDDPSNLGPTCGNAQSCGQPINAATGNMWHTERDYVSHAPTSKLELTRTYNSTPYNWDGAALRAFGTRWTHRYDAVLKQERAFTPGKSPGECVEVVATGAIHCIGPVAPALPSIPEAISILRGDGKKYLFNRNGDRWLSKADITDQVMAVFDAGRTKIEEWQYISSQGDVIERYNDTGMLISIVARNGATQLLTYSNGTAIDSRNGRIPANAPICEQAQTDRLMAAGKLLCVTDQAGRQLNFHYDAKGRISSVLDPANKIYSYEYDGPSAGCLPESPYSAACEANNLTKVTYPDGTYRLYRYNEAEMINGGNVCAGGKPVGSGFANLYNAWTGLIDENGARFISWTYDCMGRATSSEVGTGIEKVVLDYKSSSFTDVTHFLGTVESPKATTSRINIAQVLGTSKSSGASTPCVECEDIAERTFDANGNVAMSKDWGGYYSCFAYDLVRNLEIARIEGASSAACPSLLTSSNLERPMRKVSTRWHTSYRLPIVVAEPRKLTSYTYDANGNLLSLKEQPTNDETGAQGFMAVPAGMPRVRSYTYNSIGQRLTAKGPRSDIDDTTVYSYDNQNNLVSVVNAAKQKTTFQNYDANGRVGRMIVPSGAITDFTYHPRGWLASSTVTADGVAERTDYEYDNVGQLTRVTAPGAVSTIYTYDEAHRLTSVTDSLGNSIRYTLDLRGNRVREQVMDPAGTLARQTSRVYDALNRVLQQTGAIQ